MACTATDLDVVRPALRETLFASITGMALRSSDAQLLMRLRKSILMNNSIRLVIADVDGTLVTREKVLTARDGSSEPPSRCRYRLHRYERATAPRNEHAY